MKAAPVVREMTSYPDTFEQLIVHTGQHYDANMSKVFFEELDMIEPHINLEVGSGSHAWQTAHILLRFEPVILDYQPDWVVVYGDVNSTLACSLVSKKLERRVAHVEAGLRSFDHTMPEEINRLVTDQLADLLFTHSEEATGHLVNEGIAAGKIYFVGNVMIDTLVNLLSSAEDRWPQLKSLYPYDRYVLVTLHRPSNVDDRATLKEIMSALDEMSTEIPILFPIHPRTQKRIEEFDLKPKHPDLILLSPLGYLDFLALQIHASVVLTDSGGIQEETTFLGIPCLTARPNTERPVTITQGTNQLVESTSEAILNALRTRLAVHDSPTRVPPLWDGNSAKRIIQVFKQVGANPK